MVEGVTRDGLAPGPVAAMVAALLVCTFTQCVCQSTRKDGPPGDGGDTATAPAGRDASAPADPSKSPPAAPGTELPATVDARDLDADERKALREVLDEQFDPCGEPVSFYESLSKPAPCERATELAAFTVDLVSKGLSKRQIRREIVKELARTTTKVEFSLEGTPHLGEPGAPHVLVEFLDFQCPFCKATSKTVMELAKKHGAVLYIKQLPLEDHHPFAKEAALAALAAHRQGRFWPVYEALFEKQNVLSSDLIRQIAKDAGLDMDRFQADLAGPDVKAQLARDVEEADAAGVEGTPTLYLDGYVVEIDQLEAKLERAATEAKE